MNGDGCQIKAVKFLARQKWDFLDFHSHPVKPNLFPAAPELDFEPVMLLTVQVERTIGDGDKQPVGLT